MYVKKHIQSVVDRSFTPKQIMFSFGVLVFFLILNVNLYGDLSFSSLNVYAVISFLVNGLLWIFLLVNEVMKKSFSLFFIVWFFCLYFFFFAGFTQYTLSYYPWISYAFSDSQIFTFNICLLLWTFSLLAGSKFCGGRSRRSRKISDEILHDKIWIFILSASLICGYRIVTVGISNLFSRSTSEVAVSINTSLSMVIDKLLMSIMYFSTAYSILHFRKYKKKFPMNICGLCMLVAYFPTGSARNVIAGLYLGCFLLMFPSLRHNRVFSVMFMISFMIVFPLLNAFRNTSFSEVDIFKALKSIMNNYATEWLAGDYDAYTMFGTTFNYVKENGSSLGYQLLGVLLFFVPRSIWGTKPYGSGYFLGDNLGWSFKNVSCPLPGEMLINFGMIGMLIFALFFGFLIKWLDNTYWQNSSDDDFNVFDPLYCYMVGYFLFICRGDLLSSFAYLMSVIFVWLILNLIDLKGENSKITKCKQ